MPGRDSAVRIVVLAHDLLGTYGDLGNGTVLAARLRWRGHAAELVVHEGGTATIWDLTPDERPVEEIVAQVRPLAHE